MTIRIWLADGDVRMWSQDEYTSYTIEGGLFIVQREEAWVGIYPLGQLRSVEVR